ncbi:MAG: TOBE domain-containing protein, partial [Hyphomicrobiaceae bacterium]
THDQVEAMTMADRLVVMNGGIAEQIGTPREVYRAPATKFVAGFIGSPAMNFVRAVPSSDRQGITAFGVDLPVPDGTSIDGINTIDLGVRPEHLKIEPDTGTIQLIVDAVENLGNDTIVYGRTDAAQSETIAIRVDGDRDFERDSSIRIGLDPAAIHLFDAETHKRL